MRTRGSRTVVVDEYDSPGGESLNEAIELSSDDELVSRRVTRGMTSKSKSLCTEAATEIEEGEEDSENDVNGCVDKLQRHRKGKSKIEAGEEDSENDVNGCVDKLQRQRKGKSKIEEGEEDSENDVNGCVDKFQMKRKGKSKISEIADGVIEKAKGGTSRFAWRGDIGKGINLGVPTMRSAKGISGYTIVLSSEDSDSDNDSHSISKTVGREASGYSSGMEGEEGIRKGRIITKLDKMKQEADSKEINTSERTKRTRRLGEEGRDVPMQREMGPGIQLHSASVELDDDFKLENAEKDRRIFSIAGKRRVERARQDVSGAVEPNERPDVTIEAGSPSGRGAASRKRALDIARSRASHFAHFNHEDESNSGINAQARPPSDEDAEHLRLANELLAQAQAEAQEQRATLSDEREEWPGPWSELGRLAVGRTPPAAARHDGVPLVDWSRSRDENFCRVKVPPSLHRKCLEVLCRNIDHVESMDGIPDCDKNSVVSVLSAMRKLTPENLKICISRSPTEISIPDCTCLTEEDLKNVMSSRSMERIQVLDLNMCGRGITDHCLATLCAEEGNSLPELKTLALRGAYRLVDRGLGRILNAAPKLKAVDLSLCSLISESSVEAIADTLGSTLESLVLDGCTQLLGVKLLPALRKMRNLQRLCLSGIPGVTDGVICELLVRLKLEELDVRACHGLTDAGFQALSVCPGLKILDLSHLPRLTDAVIGLIADNCRGLRALRLSRGKFSDLALAALVRASGSCLRELSLNSIRLAGDHTMMALAQSSKDSLEVLDVSWCRLISDQALGLLADSCKKLHTVKLFGCRQITNVFLEGHSNEVLKVTGI